MFRSAALPTSPSHRYATGPSLSPLKGGEGKSEPPGWRSDDGDAGLRLQRAGQRRIEGDLDRAGDEEAANVLRRDLGRCAGLRQVHVLREDKDAPDAIDVLAFGEQQAPRPLQVQAAGIDPVIGLVVEAEPVIAEIDDEEQALRRLEQRESVEIGAGE